MSAIAAPSTVKFHLSLNVADLDKSVEFFQSLFGRDAAKCRPDYAKFELDEPPVVLSLEPHAPTTSGALNHLGFRLGDSAELVEWQRRLEMAGITTQREEGVECCYARQTKFWVRDPDNNLWEIYVLEEDLDHRGMGQADHDLPAKTIPLTQQPGANLLPESAVHSQLGRNRNEPAKAIWQHQLGKSLPEKIVALDESTDEVQLRGSFNQPHTAESRRQFLSEVLRILRSGGSTSLHMLTGTQSLSLAHGTLPGPASYVTHVPTKDELVADLQTAGFSDVQVTKYGERPCFTHNSVEMRETMIVARKH
ncbi:MAG TPA: ArsI/CadI family heavy metal resistance metalloenzyme [Pirellulaceae bacterium]